MDRKILVQKMSKLSSRKLKKQVLESHNNNHIKGLIVKGRTNNKGSRCEGITRWKSKSKNIKCIKCHEVCHFRNNYPKWKDKVKKEETYDAANVSSEEEIADDIIEWKCSSYAY